MTEPTPFEQLEHRGDIWVIRHKYDELRVQLSTDLAEALAVIGEILAHHVTLNERAGRPICRSHTIKLCDGALSKHAKGG